MAPNSPHRAARSGWLLPRAVVAALLLLSALDAAARDAVVIDVVTYNVRGLPALIAQDDPRARLTRLLPRLRPFTIALLQEDFAHQDLVIALAPHRHQVRSPSRDRDWRATTGDGLTVLTSLPLVGTPIAAAFGSCNGFFSAANDCFSDKGVLGQRVRLTNAATLDLYTTHLDAGRSEPDEAVRREQLAVLEQVIARHSAGRAVLLGGDFNLHASRPAQWRALDAFRKRLGLQVAAIVPATGRKRVDYLFVRGAADVAVTVLRSGVATGFVGADGEPLSDHPPVQARLHVRAISRAANPLPQPAPTRAVAR